MGKNTLTQKQKAFRKWRENNRDYDKARKREYSVERKEQLNKQTRQWHQNNPIKSLLGQARGRASRNNLPFDISHNDLVLPDICPVLGIPIEIGRGARTDNSPSLDRKRPELGYVKDNVFVISWRANRLKSNASPEELNKLAEYANS
jgi:hypothetical protein